MSTVHLPNHAARREQKTTLFENVIAALRADHGFVWCEALRERSLIVGQVCSKAVVVFVKLRGIQLSGDEQAFIARVNASKGIGFVARDPHNVALYLRGLA